MLEGCVNLTLDAKGRMTVPVVFRESMGREVVLTAHYASLCLLLFPASTWESVLVKIQSLPPQADRLRRHLIGNANRLVLDDHARIVIPPRLRRFARFEKMAIMRGQITHCEIWDEATLDEEEMSAIKAARRQIQEMGVPKGMEDFSF